MIKIRKYSGERWWHLFFLDLPGDFGSSSQREKNNVVREGDLGGVRMSEWEREGEEVGWDTSRMKSWVCQGQQNSHCEWDAATHAVTPHISSSLKTTCWERLNCRWAHTWLYVPGHLHKRTHTHNFSSSLSCYYSGLELCDMEKWQKRGCEWMTIYEKLLHSVTGNMLLNKQRAVHSTLLLCIVQSCIP